MANGEIFRPALSKAVLLTSQQQKARDSWQWRAIHATRSNQSKIGCILLAVLRKPAKNPPRLTGLAVILEDGTIVCDYQHAKQFPVLATRVCTVQELTDNFRRLADDLKLNDIDRMEMFLRLRQWIQKDFRATSGPLDPLTGKEIPGYKESKSS